MKLPEIGRLDGGIEDSSSRWTTQGFSGYGINMINARVWGFGNGSLALKREHHQHKQKSATHENEGGSAESRVSGPVRCTSLSISQTTSPYRSTHEPHDPEFTSASASLGSSFRVLRALSV